MSTSLVMPHNIVGCLRCGFVLDWAEEIGPSAVGRTEGVVVAVGNHLAGDATVATAVQARTVLVDKGRWGRSRGSLVHGGHSGIMAGFSRALRRSNRGRNGCTENWLWDEW